MSSIGVNKVILLGNAGQDAEVRSTSAGKSVANFSLAINPSATRRTEMSSGSNGSAALPGASWRKSLKGL